ncbi:MAG: hypothetical protein KBS81_02725 [Spirochaetales bacterium]|nr:hypothetical protein [Candidatus Physcosoma equi]
MKSRKLHLHAPKQQNKMQVARNIAAVVIFVIVAVVLCLLLVYMQNKASESKQ